MARKIIALGDPDLEPLWKNIERLKARPYRRLDVFV